MPFENFRALSNSLWRVPMTASCRAMRWYVLDRTTTADANLVMRAIRSNVADVGMFRQMVGASWDGLGLARAKRTSRFWVFWIRIP